jgi:FkbM family methyltransferase
MKTFVEIGACDFGTLNALGGDGGWQGVIVEPVKKYLDRLDRRENVTYLNAAIDTEAGERELWLCSEKLCENDRDFSGMSSFHKWPAHSESITVPTLTYGDLLKRCGFDRVDFLKIDTEGHDLTILETVDFSGTLKPQLIKVEHKHCSLDKILNVLQKNGYLCDVTEQDVWAISKK